MSQINDDCDNQTTRLSEKEILDRLSQFLNKDRLSERDELLIHAMLCCIEAIERLEEATGQDSEYLSYLIGAEAFKQKSEMTRNDKINFLKEMIYRTPIDCNE